MVESRNKFTHIYFSKIYSLFFSNLVSYFIPELNPLIFLKDMFRGLNHVINLKMSKMKFCSVKMVYIINHNLLKLCCEKILPMSFLTTFIRTQGVGQGGRQGAYIHFGKEILEKATHFLRKCFPKKTVFANSLLFS